MMKESRNNINYNAGFFNITGTLFKKESAGGVLLCIAAILALTIANSPLREYYTYLVYLPVSLYIGDFNIVKPLVLWVNDGLMAIFFFLIGLELKREMLEGVLSDKRNILLPALGAIGGMAVPALVYIALNYNDPITMEGWAIPAATDIAFSLGVLALFGTRAPIALKVLLTSIAIFDDVGAVIIIALFYTSDLSLFSLGIASICCVVLFGLNRAGLLKKSLYILVGIIMWGALLKSGVHATLSGIVLALFIPISDRKNLNSNYSPLKALEHDLHDTVAFFILPLFAFCNTGINMTGLGPEQLFHPVPMGVALGLFAGKQLGVFGLSWLGIKSGLAKMPEGTNMLQIYGISILCGIGLTMSLFIGSLAFDEPSVNYPFDERIGIIMGSLLSGIWGYMVLRWGLKSKNQVASS
ncbi:MAG: Na+/H+ antiporter NhaA [Alphaproteobacteria bacterium]